MLVFLEPILVMGMFIRLSEVSSLLCCERLKHDL